MMNCRQCRFVDECRTLNSETNLQNIKYSVAAFSANCFFL